MVREEKGGNEGRQRGNLCIALETEELLLLELSDHELHISFEFTQERLGCFQLGVLLAVKPLPLFAARVLILEFRCRAGHCWRMVIIIGIDGEIQREALLRDVVCREMKTTVKSEFRSNTARLHCRHQCLCRG